MATDMEPEHGCTTGIDFCRAELAPQAEAARQGASRATLVPFHFKYLLNFSV